MKVCKYCGQTMDEGDAFCANCGARVNDKEPATAPAENAIVEPKSIQIFAFIGMGLGIFSLVTAFIPFANLFTSVSSGIAGIVFSVLGKKSQRRKTNAKVGLILSIVGIALAIVLFVVYLLLMKDFIFEFVSEQEEYYNYF